MNLGLKTKDSVSIKESKYSEGDYSMLYWNTPPSSISNLVLYPCSKFVGKLIFLLGLILFNWESIESRFLQVSYASSVSWIYHGLCLNNFLRVLLLSNERYLVPLLRYINREDEVSHLVRGSKVLGGMKYLMRPVKQSAEAVGVWN